MRCPSVNELPPPPAGKSGWPWTEGDSSALPAEAGRWPKISIVTPSYNQAAFLERTIRSVLLQSYPDVEYIVMDGGSGDGSAEIIRKYERWLAFWTSGKDRGQSHALNEGFGRATGEVFGWLNSDDFYMPGALAALARLRSEHPEAMAWAGAVEVIDETGRKTRRLDARPGTREQLACWDVDAFIPQPGCLFGARAFQEAGGVKENLHYSMDAELWLRLRSKGAFESTDAVVACAQWHAAAKTVTNYTEQMVELVANAFNQGLPASAKKLLLHYLELRMVDALRTHYVGEAMTFRELMTYAWRRFVFSIRKRLTGWK